MFRAIPHLILLLLLGGWFSISLFACKSTSPSEPKLPTLPSLTDPIPYARLGQGKLLFERIGPTNNNYQGLYVLDIANSRASSSINGTTETPSLSPDGQKIIYAQSIPGGGIEWETFVANIDGSSPQNISGIVGRDIYPSWSTNSLAVLFFVDSTVDGAVRLYRQSPVATPSNRVEITKFNPPRIPLGSASVSPTERLVLISHGESIVEIHTMNMNGTDPKLLVSNSTAGKSLYSPVWSRDGQKIAYIAAYQDANGQYNSLDIMLMSVDGSNQVVLAAPQASGRGYGGQGELSLSWSPDGSKIVFNRPEGDLVSHLYLINADGSGLVQVTSAAGVADRNVSWAN